MKAFFRLGWRYLIRHPWQSILMVLGITLGVAVVVAVDLANTSASRAFDLSTEAVTGKATHQITGGPQGLDEGLYTTLRRSGVVQAAAPVINAYAASPQLGGVPLQLLGVDPFAEPPFRDYLGETAGGTNSARPAPAAGELITLLTEPGAVLISAGMAERYGLSPGEPIELELEGETHPAFIAGLLHPSDGLSRRALEGLILADIATAQEFTGRLGTLDRIDLILTRPESQIPQIEALLPTGLSLQTVAARRGAVEQMTSAFRVNLTALSLLALVVGMFLIYNTMTFSVVQRRPLFGTLRSLGVTRREVFGMVLIEAALAGVLGSALGLGLGVLMGQGAVRLVTQTINDLFFTLSVQGVQIPAASLVKGAVLGVAATLATAVPPAWEAASAPPRQVLTRSSLEGKTRKAIRLAAWAGGAVMLAGGGILAIPTRSLVVSFAGTFAVVVGFAMLAPLLTGALMRLAAPVLGRLWGILGRMAPRAVIASLSRTATAVAALMVAVSVTIGVSLMIGSFRQTVIAWLEQTLQGDVYISAPGLTGSTPSTPLDPGVTRRLASWPGVERVDVVRSVTVDSPQGPVEVMATNNFTIPQERIFAARSLPVQEMWPALESGSVLISEPLANRLEIPAQGGEIVLNTAQGQQRFPVAGIYYDYASTQGTVLFALPVYRRLWEDPAITAASLRLSPGTEADRVVRELQDALAGEQNLVIRANRTLRDDVLEVFDRTFAITGALQLLATVVAFIGVLSALLSLELERQREQGILRAIGLTVRQLWGLIMLETGLLGAVAGLLAMPCGYALALILVYVINRRSFGWTLQMQVWPEPFIMAVVVALTAALLAGIYPARRISRSTTAEAVRFE